MTRNTEIQIRVSQDEKAELRRKAELHGLTISQYLRAVGLQREDSGTAGPLAPGPVSRLKIGGK